MSVIYPVTPESAAAILETGDPHDGAPALVRAVLLDAATPLQQLAALRQLSATTRKKARWGGGMLQPHETRNLALFEAIAPPEPDRRLSADADSRGVVARVVLDALRTAATREHASVADYVAARVVARMPPVDGARVRRAIRGAFASVVDASGERFPQRVVEDVATRAADSLERLVEG